MYPGTARGDFSNMQLDPNNPKTLIVKTHAESWDRTITVYIPPQYKKDTEVPFIVANDGPHYGSPDASLAGVLDNLINQHRLPAMIQGLTPGFHSRPEEEDCEFEFSGMPG